MTDEKRRAIENYRALRDAALRFVEADEAWRFDPTNRGLATRAVFQLGRLQGVASSVLKRCVFKGTDFEDVTREDVGDD